MTASSGDRIVQARIATEKDVDSIREIFLACYDEGYPYRQFIDPDELKRMVYAESTTMLVAEDEAGQVCGTASVVFDAGARNDLAAEFGRLAVHPGYRGRGIGRLLMEARIESVKDRIHVGIVENRCAHQFSQRISEKHGFVPVGFLPMKLLFHRRESVALYCRHFSNALAMRKNNPRILPEVYPIADMALRNCGLDCDAIVDVEPVAYPHSSSFELEEFTTQGYASLLRFQRGRVKQREVYGPVRLHYGLFQLDARHSHYLLARRDGQLLGGIGFMLDKIEKSARIFELITVDEEPVYFLIQQLGEYVHREWDVAYLEIDVSAHSPRMQRTLLELGYSPTGYVPALAFDEVERIDIVKMSRLLVPLDTSNVEFSDVMKPLGRCVLRQFHSRDVIPRLAEAMENVELFHGMTDEQARQVAAVCAVVELPADELVFRQGDPAKFLHLILSGKVKVMKGDAQVVVGSASQSETLGESSIVSELPHSATVVTEEPTEIARLPVVQLRRLAARRPDIGLIVMRNLARSLADKLRRSTQVE